MSDHQVQRLDQGQDVRWRHVVTEKDVDDFAGLSGDTNPLHLDNAYARKRGFRGRVVHGMLLGAYLSKVLGTIYPGSGTLWLSQDFQFLRPVYIDEQIEIVVSLVHHSDALNSQVLKTVVLNEQGDTVLTGEARVMTEAHVQQVPWEEMVILVTGGSRGIGAGIARALGENGAKVVVNYREQEKSAAEIVSEINASGGQGLAVKADLSTVQGAQDLADAALDAYGRVDAVVNNAIPPIVRKPLMELDWDEVESHWQTSVQGSFILAQRLIPGMKERKFGRIVNILSSYHAGTPPPDMYAYLVAKGAMWAGTKSMAIELAPHGITVNAVSPSPVMTDQWSDVPESRRRALSMRVPLGRLCSVEDVARSVLYLIGEGGSFVTGADIPVAGGEIMQP